MGKEAVDYEILLNEALSGCEEPRSGDRWVRVKSGTEAAIIADTGEGFSYIDLADGEGVMEMALTRRGFLTLFRFRKPVEGLDVGELVDLNLDTKHFGIYTNADVQTGGQIEVRPVFLTRTETQRLIEAEKAGVPFELLSLVNIGIDRRVNNELSSNPRQVIGDDVIRRIERRITP